MYGMELLGFAKHSNIQPIQSFQSTNLTIHNDINIPLTKDVFLPSRNWYIQKFLDRS